MHLNREWTQFGSVIELETKLFVFILIQHRTTFLIRKIDKFVHCHSKDYAQVASSIHCKRKKMELLMKSAHF